MSTVIDTPDGIAAFQMLRLRGALVLEIKGFRFKGGRSVAKFVREQYGLECGRSKRATLEALEALMREKGVMFE